MGLEGDGGWFLEIDVMGIAVGGVAVDDVLLFEKEGGDIIGGGGIGVVISCCSTGFLERFLPLCMCLSQYLESG